MSRQIETHHYCSRLSQNFIQCAVYDTDEINALLLVVLWVCAISVEYIVPADVFETFPPEEQKLWHSHAYEVSVPEVIAMPDLENFAQTYGKFWCTWQVDRVSPGLVRADLVLERDAKYNISSDGLKSSRLEIPEPEMINPLADYWKQHGKGFGINIEETEMKSCTSNYGKLIKSRYSELGRQHDEWENSRKYWSTNKVVRSKPAQEQLGRHNDKYSFPIFHNLTDLLLFSISSKRNPFALKVTQDWIPPFKHLYQVEIRDCQVGPTFPNWLRNQMSLENVILENVGISEEILGWLYNMSSHIEQLDLSHNKISRYLPKKMNFSSSNSPKVNFAFNQLKGPIPIWSGVTALYLRYSLLSGTLPANIGEEMSHLKELDLSNDLLNRSIPLSITRIQNLSYLDLSKNHLTGEIPVFGMEITKNLPLLSELLSRGNTLTGSIPEELCRLPYLHLLDLANNNLSDLVLKGRLIEYLNQMPVHSTIDLSNNYLPGEIPESLTELTHLGVLNLACNRLIGNIPNNVGSLTDLESLDLSHNSLSGPIPASMTSMTFLSFLNLSYDNLSVQIPVANQFGTFNDPSTYEGNPQLCGGQLPTNFSLFFPENGAQEKKHEDGADEDDDKTERLWLYASIAIGYITGFWLVCGSLVLKRSWRHAYFKFVFDMRDNLLVWIAINLAGVKRRFGLERN
ncbi:Receptor-like protein EIX2 [Glycine max]|nr:Receptor-like protein EIX2 [Glycine max]